MLETPREILKTRILDLATLTMLKLGLYSLDTVSSLSLQGEEKKNIRDGLKVLVIIEVCHIFSSPLLAFYRKKLELGHVYCFSFLFLL
jgi:hypothetical protein